MMEAEDMVCLIISKREPYSMLLKCVELMFPKLEGAVDPLFLFVQTMPTLAPGAVLRKNIWGPGPGPSSFGKQQRLSEITIEQITSTIESGPSRATAGPGKAFSRSHRALSLSHSD